MRKLLATACALAAALALTVGAAADDGRGGDELTFAVIGDTPYGPAQEALFPSLVTSIDDDRDVRLALHLGDIKTGSSLCTDEYFAQIKSLFDTFDDPLVYTPGDNEWTDCHRPAQGGYDPLERLSKLRSVFYPQPGLTLGARPKRVDFQHGFPENQLWEQSDIVFSAVHVVGSNNDLVPWFGAPQPSPEQLEEFETRLQADLEWLDRTFELAEDERARGVVIAMQADMWLGTVSRGVGFDPIIERISELADDFERPVLLLQGDTHDFYVDKPVPSVQNLTRIVVEGEIATEWLRIEADRRSRDVFFWERIILEPTLLARAILPSDAYQPGPPSGNFIQPDNGVTPPFPGQPIPGFSAVLNAGHGNFFGMPDNGFGAKTNSGDFLLRLYRIRPDFETEDGGDGTVDVRGFIQLRDPNRKIPFPLFRPDRILTGADFDLESVRRTRKGDLWFGEEFGPFLLHTDETGKVLEAPIPLPGVQSPQNAFLTDPNGWNLPASRGFEGTALSADGKFLYPMLEGALRTDPDPRRRIVNEFDLRRGRYSGRTWSYRVDAAFPNAVIGDFTALDRNRLILIERDDAQGVDALQKKIYLVDLRRVDADGYLEKRLVLDLLRIRDPELISLPARPGEFGVGDPFSFPLQSVESLEVLGDDRLLIANDNNYPGSDGRWIARDRPDDVELIVVRTPLLRKKVDPTRRESSPTRG
jgi:hypothetical protein